MRFFTFIGAVILAAIAVASAGQDFGWIASLFIILAAAWLVFFSFGGLGKGKLPPGVVLELRGIRWSEEDFCRGWEIDGRTGSGKTASAVVPIIHQLKKNRPDVGILALDTKGDLSEPLARIADNLSCRDSFVQLEVRPEGASLDWKPAATMNFLADTTIPYSTYAKIIVDVATAAGQKGGQAFFKVAAQTAIQNTFSAMAALRRPVTIPACAEVIASPGKYEEMGKALLALSKGRPDVVPLVHYFHEFVKQPPEQLGGIRSLSSITSSRSRLLTSRRFSAPRSRRFPSARSIKGNSSASKSRKSTRWKRNTSASYSRCFFTSMPCDGTIYPNSSAPRRT